MNDNISSNNVNGNYNHRRKRRFYGRKLPSAEKKDSLKSISTHTSSKEINTEKKDNSVIFAKKDFSKTSSKKRKNKNAKNNENSKKQNLKKEDFKRLFIKNEFNKYKKTKSASKGFLRKIKKEDLPYHTESLPMSICPICNKPIANMMTALANDDSKSYVHFDCVYDKLKSKVTMKGNERFSYIGNGTFAVIEDYKDGQYSKFRIKHQIQFSETRPAK